MVNKNICLILGIVLMLSVVSAWSVEITDPVDGENYNHTLDYFDWTYELTNNDSCWYSLDNGQTNITMTTCDLRQDNNIISKEGYNTWTVWINDTSGDIYSNSSTFWVDSIKPDLDYITPHSNLTYTNQDNFDFQFWLNESNKHSYDNNNFTPFYLEVYIPNSIVKKQSTLGNLSSSDDTYSEIENLAPTGTDLKEGKYKWVVYSNDIFPNGSKIRDAFSINITGKIIRDKTNPDMAINNPQNNSNESKFINFDISSKDIDNSVDGFFSGINHTIINITNSSDEVESYANSSEDFNWNWNSALVADGDYNITATAYDKAGNTNSTTITIHVDNHAPNVSIKYPIKDDSYNYSITKLNYTMNEEHPDKCWYSNDSGINNYSFQTAGKNFTNMISKEGENNWIVYCNDTFGNTGHDIINFSVDTTAPRYSDNKTNLTLNTKKGNKVYFNITLNDSNPDKYVFSFYNGSSWKNKTSNFSIGEEIQK
ncbi:MAG: Ig-like domain-containing protein, partial [bacterium]